MPTWKPNFDFYETSLHGARAIVRLDLAAVAHAPVNTHPMLVKIGVEMVRPREDGLRSDEETAALFALEEKLSSAMEHQGHAIYVGRVMAQGCTEFYFYAPFAAPVTTDGPAVLVGDITPYQLEWSAESDSAWAWYDQVFPDSHAMLTISNRGQQRVMQQRGDPLNVPRQVEHAAVFPSEQSGRTGSEALAKAGFQVTDLEDRKDGTWSLQFHRVDRCDGNHPDRFGLEILVILEPLGGDYDGWRSAAEVKPRSA